VLLVKEGNSLAYAEIFKRYHLLVLGICLKYLKSKDKAEDLMMVVFEHLQAKIKKHEIKSLRNWLYTIAKNECLMELRKKKPKETDLSMTLLQHVDESNQLLELVNLKEVQISKLEAAITKLKENQKICIQLFYIEQKSYDQVSAATRMTLKEVKSNIQNGKRNLALILSKEDERE
jgi:RNA polymerase sigma-70 factor (ECF subfamily)